MLSEKPWCRPPQRRPARAQRPSTCAAPRAPQPAASAAPARCRPHPSHGPASCLHPAHPSTATRTHCHCITAQGTPRHSRAHQHTVRHTFPCAAIAAHGFTHPLITMHTASMQPCSVPITLLCSLHKPAQHCCARYACEACALAPRAPALTLAAHACERPPQHASCVPQHPTTRFMRATTSNNNQHAPCVQYQPCVCHSIQYPTPTTQDPTVTASYPPRFSHDRLARSLSAIVFTTTVVAPLSRHTCAHSPVCVSR